jgi:uncharacterized protein (DUF1501 family)
MMVSDFGRTPRYNDGQGKDHHPISSWMFWGAGIKGNRGFGASTHEHDALPVDPQTGKEKQGGVIITPGLIHKELRKFFDVDDKEVSARFPSPRATQAVGSARTGPRRGLPSHLVRASRSARRSRAIAP